MFKRTCSCPRGPHSATCASSLPELACSPDPRIDASFSFSIKLVERPDIATFSYAYDFESEPACVTSNRERVILSVSSNVTHH